MKVVKLKLLVVLFFCAGLSVAAQDQKKSIAFVSLLGEQARLAYRDAGSELQPAADWGIDQYVDEQAGNILKKNTEYRFVDVRLDREEYKKMSYGRYLNDSDRDILNTFANKNKLDRVVVLVPTGIAVSGRSIFVIGSAAEGAIMANTANQGSEIAGYGVLYDRGKASLAAYASTRLELVKFPEKDVDWAEELQKEITLDDKLKPKELSEEEKNKIREDFKRRAEENDWEWSGIQSEVNAALSLPHHNMTTFTSIRKEERELIGNRVKLLIDKYLESKLNRLFKVAAQTSQNDF